MKKYATEPVWFIVLTTAAASSVSLIGGIGLESVAESLLPLIPMIVALPALNTMVGDYSTIIAAHAGDPFERERTRKQLVKAISWSVIFNILGVTILSLILAARRGFDLDFMFVLRFGLFITVAIIATVIFMFVITYILDKLLEKRRLNPDDILIPIVTSVSDVLMLGTVALGVATFFSWELKNSINMLLYY